jgi:hypothetical protein
MKLTLCLLTALLVSSSAYAAAPVVPAPAPPTAAPTIDLTLDTIQKHVADHRFAPFYKSGFCEGMRTQHYAYITSTEGIVIPYDKLIKGDPKHLVITFPNKSTIDCTLEK